MKCSEMNNEGLVIPASEENDFNQPYYEIFIMVMCV